MGNHRCIKQNAYIYSENTEKGQMGGGWFGIEQVIVQNMTTSTATTSHFLLHIYISEFKFSTLSLSLLFLGAT